MLVGITYHFEVALILPRFMIGLMNLLLAVTVWEHYFCSIIMISHTCAHLSTLHHLQAVSSEIKAAIVVYLLRKYQIVI